MERLIVLIVACTACTSTGTTVLDSVCSFSQMCQVIFNGTPDMFTFHIDHPLLERILITPMFRNSVLNITMLSRIDTIDMTVIGSVEPCQTLICGQREVQLIAGDIRSRICCKQMTRSSESVDSQATTSTPTTTSMSTTTRLITSRILTTIRRVATTRSATSTTSASTTVRTGAAGKGPITSRVSTTIRAGAAAEAVTTSITNNTLREHPPSSHAQPATFTTSDPDLQTAVISLAASTAIVLVALVAVLIFHRLKLLRIKRVHLPMMTLSLTSTTTPVRRSVSDPSLNQSQIESDLTSSPDPILPSAPHRYSTRYQKRRLHM